MTYIYLALIGLINCIQCWYYYAVAEKQGYYLLFMAFLGGISALLFVLLSRHTTEPSELFKFGVYYDIIMIVSWTVLPFVVFGAKLSLVGWSGLFLVLLGGALLHL